MGSGVKETNKGKKTCRARWREHQQGQNNGKDGYEKKSGAGGVITQVISDLVNDEPTVKSIMIQAKKRIISKGWKRGIEKC